MLALCVVLLPQAAIAGDARLQVVDSQGRPLANALVYSATPSGVDPDSRGEAVITQRDMEFRPQFLAIPVGTTVRFPNEDRTRHHVYSFSPAKIFELKLYRGELADPVRFDQPGLVTLGCNVHDWMIGYVYIVDARHYALTDESGIAVVPGAPGDEHWQVSHPYLKSDAVLAERGGQDSITLTVTLRDAIAVPERPASTRVDSRIGERRAR